MASWPDPAGAVRTATSADNAALLALTAACPMEGDIGLCVERAPDFFALNRLEGDRFEVGVVDGPDGMPVGCIAVAEREVYLHGRPASTMYVGDLKVHPAHRGTGVADQLSAWARDLCRAWGGDAVPTLVTILAGNRAMHRRLAGDRGLPHLHRFATIRSHSVSLLWRRRPPAPELRVERAGEADLEEMADLWRKVAPERQFAAVLDAESLAGWVEEAPGLALSSYLLARGAGGRPAGFLALWDQDSLKQLRVTSYSRRLAGFRLGFNAVAPALGAARLPAAGGAMRHLTAVHVCVSVRWRRGAAIAGRPRLQRATRSRVLVLHRRPRRHGSPRHRLLGADGPAHRRVGVRGDAVRPPAGAGAGRPPPAPRDRPGLTPAPPSRPGVREVVIIEGRGRHLGVRPWRRRGGWRRWRR